MTPAALVLLKLVAVLAPLVLLAGLTRTYPTRRLLTLALLPAGLTFPLLLGPWALAPVLLVDLLLAAAALFDLTTLPAQRAFSPQRTAGRVASLKMPHPVSLTLTHHGRRPCRVSIRDGVPPQLNPQPAEFSHVLIPPHRRAVFDYRLQPARRGAFTIDQLHLKALSRLGLFKRFLRYPLETIVHVYPDMKQLAQYAVLARINQLSQLGVRRTRRIGQDHDFERLRDYTPDDNYKHIDWRATARRRKLTVRQFQSSQSQRVIFLVDCGRMMTNQAAGLSLLDHALNAMLMLGYVALARGDNVGLLCFSDQVHGFVPPRGGLRQMNRLLHAGFNRFPHLVESRYDLAFRYLGAHARKRSLVVLITNCIDQVNANQIQQYLTNLVGRHLPLGVLLRDHRLFDAVDVDHPTGDALFQAAAAADILAWRHHLLSDLTAQGALTLDVFPEEMTAPLVNRYLEIKARHLL